MLNLLRFRDVADYSADPQLAPDEPISGAEAYRRYADHTMPFLIVSGGEVVVDGALGPRHGARRGSDDEQRRRHRGRRLFFFF